MEEQNNPESNPERIKSGAGEKPAEDLAGHTIGSLSIQQALHDTEPGLSANEVELQAVVEWAETVYDEFDALPETNPVKAKKEKRRDERFIDRALAQFSETQEQNHLIDNPRALARSLELWTMWSEEYEGRGEEFVSLVNSRLYEHSRRNWNNMSKPTLAGLAQELAHSPLAKDGLESTLKGYFEGPGQIKDRQHANLQMCLSAQHVLNDQKAIDKITEIVCFKTDVMPYSGVMHDVVQGDVANYAYFVEEGKNAGDLNRIREGLAGISSFGRKIAREVYEGGSKDKLNKRHANAFMKTYGLTDWELASKLLDERDFLRIKEHSSPAKFRMRQDDIEAIFKDDLSRKIVFEWYKEVSLSPSPYLMEYNQTFGNRWTEENWKRKEVQEFGVIEQIISIPTEDGFQFDIYLPEGDMHLSEDDIEAALAQYRTKIQSMKDADEDDYTHLKQAKTDPDYEGSYDIEFEITIAGREIAASVHTQCELDSLSEHDLNKLMLANIPDLSGEDFISADTIWQRMHRAEEERYVSKRGFKVDFKSEDLLQAGLESITFKQDPQNLQQLLASLDFKGQPIEYRLDEFGNLDLEGRQLYSSKLIGVIHRRTLAVLEHYMSKDVLETEEGKTISSGEAGTITRPASVVFLPEGSNFSESARQRYMLEQGKDLMVRSEERKLNNPRAKGRNSTYRRATEVDDSNLEPIKLVVNNPAIV